MFSLILFLFLMIPLGRTDGPQPIAIESSAVAGARAQEALWQETEESSSSISKQEMRGKGCTFNVALENISSSAVFTSIRIRAIGETEITDVQPGYWTLVSSSPTQAVLKPPQGAIPVGLFICGISIRPSSGSSQQIQIEWIGSKETVLCTRVLNVGCGRKSDEARLAARQRDDKEMPVQGEQASCKDVSASITSDEVLTKVEDDYDCDADFTASFGCNPDWTTPYSFINTTTDESAAFDPYYKWTISDSNSEIYTTTSTNAYYTFQSPGHYTVQLCASGTACSTLPDSCDEDAMFEINIPRALFSWKPKQCDSRTIEFTDNSGEAVLSYRWTFGDGGTSNLSSPEHTFLNYGTYQVCLGIITSEGCNRICQYVNISSAPNVDFDWDYSVCDPKVELKDIPVHFTDKTTGGQCPYQYTWQFDNGPISHAVGPTYAFDGGQHLVTLTIKDSNNQIAQKSHPFEIKARSPLSLTRETCSTSEVMFSTNEPNPTWKFPNGNPSTATGSQVTTSYSSPGTYTATLTSKDEYHNVCSRDEIVRIIEIMCCTKNHRYRDHYEFDEGDNRYRMIVMLVVRNTLSHHHIKVKTKLKKKGALAYWPLRAHEIRAKVQGKVYRPSGACCCGTEDLLFGGDPAGETSHSARIVRFKTNLESRFRTRAHSVTSIHYVKVTSTSDPFERTHSFGKCEKCKD